MGDGPVESNDFMNERGLVHVILLNLSFLLKFLSFYEDFTVFIQWCGPEEAR